jgi:hypothetical protein
MKIEHRAIQPPKASPNWLQQSPSIAEIVHSPLPAATPSAISPTTATPSYNVDEIMNMFKQAYTSSQATSPHPTFETIQDAIIREINSHDAFLQIRPETTSALLTPSPTRDTFNEADIVQPVGTDSNKSSPEKEKQSSKFTGKGALGRTRRNSDTHRKLSIVPLKGYDKKVKRNTEPTGRKRRHTYAQPPSVDLTAAMNTFPPDIPIKPKKQSSLRDIILKPSSRQLSTDAVPKRESDQGNAVRRPTSNNDAQPNKEATVPEITRGKITHLRHAIRRSQGANVPTNNGNSEPPAAVHEDTEAPQLPYVETPCIQLDTVDGDHNIPLLEPNMIQNLPFPLPLNNITAKSNNANNPTLANTNASNDTDNKQQPITATPLPLERKRIPVRRSSLKKDMFDSGRMGW